jgi:peroxiredoxin
MPVRILRSWLTKTPFSKRRWTAHQGDPEPHASQGMTDGEVIGISSDSVESHRSFAVKHELSFTLPSDESGNIGRLYGVPNTFGLFPGRVTYVIDREGVVRHVFASQLSVERHVQDALTALRSDVSKAGA